MLVTFSMRKSLMRSTNTFMTSFRSSDRLFDPLHVESMSILCFFSSPGWNCVAMPMSVLTLWSFAAKRSVSFNLQFLYFNVNVCVLMFTLELFQPYLHAYQSFGLLDVGTVNKLYHFYYLLVTNPCKYNNYFIRI